MEINVNIDEENVKCPKCGRGIEDPEFDSCSMYEKTYSYECFYCGHEGTFTTKEVAVWVD